MSKINSDLATNDFLCYEHKCFDKKVRAFGNVLNVCITLYTDSMFYF